MQKFHILMMCQHPDLGSASDWSCCEGNLLQPIGSTTQIWEETCHLMEFLWAYCSLRNEMERNEMEICSLRNENL